MSVSISREEVATIKKECNCNPDSASLVLFGFKPLPSTFEAINCFKLTEKSYFAYPNDFMVKGSKTAFATLHASMVRKNVMAIGELLLRVTASSKLVAIIPQKEERVVEDVGDDEEIYSQACPAGFLIIPLAFHENMRALPKRHNHTPDRNMVDAAKDLIRHQNIEDSIEIGQSFENPVLRRFWNYIESVALGTALQEDFAEDDDTMMNVDDILAVAGDKIYGFKNTIPQDFEDEVENKLPRKRKAADEFPDDTGIDWIHEYKSDTLHELTVAQLKIYLKANGVGVSGKKNDLIEKVKSHIEHSQVL